MKIAAAIPRRATRVPRTDNACVVFLFTLSHMLETLYTILTKGGMIYFFS